MRKLFLILPSLFLTALSSLAQQAAEANVFHPEAAKEAQVVCGNARFTVLTPRLIRMEWAENGIFEVNPPIYKSFEVKDGEALVTFEVGKKGLCPISTELDGFELAGEDKVFYPAKARVHKNRNILRVRCPEVPNPVAVRYGMKNWSVATVYNCFGIPVSPFRTDNWE